LGSSTQDIPTIAAYDLLAGVGGQFGIELYCWDLLAFEIKAVSSPSFNTVCIFSTFISF
jgi:hypothetical protein